MKTSASNPHDWYRLADDWLAAADAVDGPSGVVYVGIELLHGAVERYLVGFLVSKGWQHQQTHDLAKLLAAAVLHDARFAAFVPLADNLTDQFLAQHYPGGDLTDVGTDYGTVRDEVDHLVALIQSLR